MSKVGLGYDGKCDASFQLESPEINDTNLGCCSRSTKFQFLIHLFLNTQLAVLKYIKTTIRHSIGLHKMVFF